ncbi:MAG: helix-hairpin-helix domain-containing protein [bacterium]
MDTIEKLKLLSSDAQYDLACACGTTKDEHRERQGEGKWLYPVTLPNGGYSILLKTLLSNACSNDCKYCPLRANANIKRCTLTVEETAKVFMEYVRRKQVFGLFLSSGVINNPDYTMDRINAVARILRYRYKYKGYIHLKIIPGASDSAIEDSISLASAISLNIETAGEQHLKLLSQNKHYMRDIIHPIKLMSRLTSRGGKFEGVKCTTQFVVGASDDKDKEIIDYMYGLYDRLNFQRVYFSAYQKGLGSGDIPGERMFMLNPDDVLLREHRLYQVDFLIRKYGFTKDDIVLDDEGNLRLNQDPKEVWAQTHPEFYPVNINRADREALLRVPGIGPRTANIIIKTRVNGRIKDLEKIGIKGKQLEKVKKYVIFE